MELSFFHYTVNKKLRNSFVQITVLALAVLRLQTAKSNFINLHQWRRVIMAWGLNPPPQIKIKIQ